MIGGVLTSYHQPFQTPDNRILALAPDTGSAGWRAVHLLSGGCSCSQKVMRHLLARDAFDGMQEQILVIDGEENYLPGSGDLLARLDQKGFPIMHIAAKDIPRNAGLRGIPLLIFASPGGKVAYIGGYGSNGDQDGEILRRIRSGQAPKPLAVLGCAIGGRLRRDADPFHLKY